MNTYTADESALLTEILLDVERIASETLKENQINGTAIAKYQGNHPDYGNLYHVDGDRNFYGWTWAELKAAEKQTGILIRIAD